MCSGDTMAKGDKLIAAHSSFSEVARFTASNHITFDIASAVINAVHTITNECAMRTVS
jgi:hypothetical protein